MKTYATLARALAGFIGACVFVAHASAPKEFEGVQVDSIAVDLPALIVEAASDPNRFAVDIPHPADPQRAGLWSVEGGNAVWRYAVKVADAVSMSFHATDVKLPAGASIQLSNGSETFPINARSLNKQGELWSRVGRGNVAYISAVMPLDQKNAFELTIVSVQAGFKGFGGAGNAKAYDTYAARSASSSCQVNFSCVKNSSNALASRAVVGLLFSNTTFCSGTLLNDVAGDFKPFVLTARHCGIASNVQWDASGVTVAWNAVADCGQPLQNVYSVATITSSGAVTRMISGPDSKGNSHGDAWLIELDSAPPVGSHPYWAGFDASDSIPAGGVYNINHGGALQQQYAADTNAPSKYGFGAGNLPNGIDGGFWNVLWTTSALQQGASGSGLIDASTNRVIGSATGGVNPSHCPGDANPPTDSFYRLAMSWAGDGTPAASIKSWLDPSSTGTVTVDGKIGPPSVEVDAPSTATVGQAFTVSWNSTDATSCTASGGFAGDGWATGPVATSGSTVVTVAAGSTPTYSVSCTNSAGTKAANTSVSIQSASAGGGGSGGIGGGGASSGGSGGGGALDLAFIWSLLCLALVRRRGQKATIH